jgi:hypothetical protein
VPVDKDYLYVQLLRSYRGGDKSVVVKLCSVIVKVNCQLGSCLVHTGHEDPYAIVTPYEEAALHVLVN